MIPFESEWRAALKRAELAEKERDAARADLAIMDADARAAFAAIVPGWDSPDALLAELDRAAAHARAYHELSQAWQARAETAEAALVVEQRLHEAIRVWYSNRPDNETLLAAWEAYCEQTGQCYTCDRMRCPECKVCPFCSGDGHAGHCSRTDDEDVGQP